MFFCTSRDNARYNKLKMYSAACQDGGANNQDRLVKLNKYLLFQRHREQRDTQTGKRKSPPPGTQLSSCENPEHYTQAILEQINLHTLLE